MITGRDKQHVGAYDITGVVSSCPSDTIFLFEHLFKATDKINLIIPKQGEIPILWFIYTTVKAYCLALCPVTSVLSPGLAPQT